MRSGETMRQFGVSSKSAGAHMPRDIVSMSSVVADVTDIQKDIIVLLEVGSKASSMTR